MLPIRLVGSLSRACPQLPEIMEFPCEPTSRASMGFSLGSLLDCAARVCVHTWVQGVMMEQLPGGGGDDTELVKVWEGA